MSDMLYQFIDLSKKDDYVGKLQAFAQQRTNGVYPLTIFIALGGTGAKALLHLRRMIMERFGRVDALEGVAYLSIDTDVRSVGPTAENVRKDPFEEAIKFQKHERYDLKVDFRHLTGDNLINYPHIREWWDPSEGIKDDFDMEKGAGQIRPLARLAFFANQKEIQERLMRLRESVVNQKITGERVDVGSLRVVVIAGWAGGTGSGTFLDMGALIRHAFRNSPAPAYSLEGFFVLPGPFRMVEKNFEKANANGFAALREVNHYLTHPFGVRWDANSRVNEIKGLYDRYVILSGTNHAGQGFADTQEVYRAIGEALFLDFSAGPLAGWVQGVRINRAQYLMSYITYSYRVGKADGTSQETHTDRWKTSFSTFGISKLVFPSWRLLNYSKFDLAARMVSMMDPGRHSVIPDLITSHRNRFMFDTGIFQGEMLSEDGDKQSHRQVQDALARMGGTETSATTVYEHIAELRNDFVNLAPEMYREKDTRDQGKRIWLDASKLLGDPGVKGNEGDWVKNILQNRIAYTRRVRENFPRVIEDYRKKPAIGPSGVAQLIRSVLEEFDRPAAQARYLDFFKGQKPNLENEAREQQANWDKRIANAHDASKGLLRSQDNHREALLMAGDAFYAYWRAKVSQVICEEGTKALDEIRGILNEELRKLEGICETMFRLKSHYEAYRDFYARKEDSELIKEVPVDFALTELLTPYLGATPESAERRLQALLNLGLRKMSLDTLAQIGAKLNSDPNGFRDNLAAQAFYALKGENGKTDAFSEEEGKPLEGFVEKYSIVRVLKDRVGEESRIKLLLENLYQRGLPWISANAAHGLTGREEPKEDAFFGFVDDAESSGFGTRLFEMFKKASTNHFPPQRIKIADPSEIIFYTELTAFPAYYSGEAGSMGEDYNRLLYNRDRRTALHIHQDYHQFQEIVPLGIHEVNDLRDAWNRFIEAMIFGIIRSTYLRSGDDNRVGYQLMEMVASNEISWLDLGPESAVIRKLMMDKGFGNRLSTRIAQAKEQFRKLEGRWWDLIALAGYYYFCVFPILKSDEMGSAFSETPMGSIQNLVSNDLRTNYRTRADENEKDGELLSIQSMDQWAVPIYREKENPVPFSFEVRKGMRIDEWQLMEEVTRAVQRLKERGFLPERRDGSGNVAVYYPRMALNWPFYRDRKPLSGGDVRYNYLGDAGRLPGLSAKEVAEIIARDPSGEHKVWARGIMDDYVDARSIGDISQALPQGTPTSEPGPAPAPERAPAPVSGPPIEPTVPLFFYRYNRQDCGQKSVKEIVASILTDPEGVHRVWKKDFGKSWKHAHEVPEISEILATLMPPPDDDDPPPDDFA